MRVLQAPQVQMAILEQQAQPDQPVTTARPGQPAPKVILALVDRTVTQGQAGKTAMQAQQAQPARAAV